VLAFVFFNRTFFPMHNLGLGGARLCNAPGIGDDGIKLAFSKAEINIGIMPTFGGTQRLPRNMVYTFWLRNDERVCTPRRFGRRR
jgi:enoyl-CoA hydratase